MGLSEAVILTLRFFFQPVVVAVHLVKLLILLDLIIYLLMCSSEMAVVSIHIQLHVAIPEECESVHCVIEPAPMVRHLLLCNRVGLQRHLAVLRYYLNLGFVNLEVSKE